MTGWLPGAAAKVIHAFAVPDVFSSKGAIVPSLVYVPSVASTVQPGFTIEAALFSVFSADVAEWPSLPSRPERASTYRTGGPEPPSGADVVTSPASVPPP